MAPRSAGATAFGDRGVTSPVSRRRCFRRRTHDALTWYLSATASAFIPWALSRNARVRKSIEYAAIDTSCEQEYHVRRTTYK